MATAASLDIKLGLLSSNWQSAASLSPSDSPLSSLELEEKSLMDDTPDESAPGLESILERAPRVENLNSGRTTSVAMLEDYCG